MAAMNTLASYIQSQPPRPKRAWAEQFGISRPHLIALMNDERAPSIEVARRIEAETGGRVPVTDWPNIRALSEALVDRPAPPEAAE